MRLALLIALLLAAPLYATTKDEPWSHPLYSPAFDVDLEFRTGRRTTGGWIHSVGAFGTFRQDIVFGGTGSLGLSARAGAEQWFGLDPAPRRLLVGTALDFAFDAQFSEVYWRWPPESDGRLRWHRFPMQRSRFFSMRAMIGVDFMRMDSLSSRVSGPGDTVPETGLRPWVGLAIGFIVVSVEPGYAPTFVFGRGGIDHETWIYVGIGRPLSPFSGHVGYRYHAADRFNTHYLSVGFQALF